jgi:FMN phosphatase YigB (HAD superfamily)
MACDMADIRAVVFDAYGTLLADATRRATA